MIAPIGLMTQDAELSMPKKKTEDDVASPRKQTLATAQLSKLLLRCEEATAEIKTVIKSATSQKVVAIELDGATKLARAIDLLESFATNLYVGLQKSKRRSSRGEEDHETV